ncbi:MAG: hypothetical protein JOY82_19725 [Streptosporangiaceae bacterium]|nr:hypothetical protein [Streptosporangiaceae bacterium]MBV9856715.1 hypothetical protein [Streptosporangiaceae bacterium]
MMRAGLTAGSAAAGPGRAEGVGRRAARTGRRVVTAAMPNRTIASLTAAAAMTGGRVPGGGLGALTTVASPGGRRHVPRADAGRHLSFTSDYF